MKVRIDRDLCIGARSCITIAPDVFALDDEDIAIVLDPSAADEETLMEAAEACPMDAVIIEDEEGGQLYP